MDLIHTQLRWLNFSTKIIVILFKTETKRKSRELVETYWCKWSIFYFELCVDWYTANTNVPSQIFSYLITVSVLQYRKLTPIKTTLKNQVKRSQVFSYMNMSIAYCNTAVTPLLTHWSYCSLALMHRCKAMFQPWLILRFDIFGMI